MKKLLGALAAILVAVCLNIPSAMAAGSAFPGCYVIGDTALLGAPIFTVDLIFNPDGSKVTGEGEIVQTINIAPARPVKTYLEGTYFAPLFEGSPYLIVSANGYAFPPFPPCPLPVCGPGPVRPQNVKNLAMNTLSGKASYQYREEVGSDFLSVGPVPLKSVPCPALDK